MLVGRFDKNEDKNRGREKYSFNNVKHDNQEMEIKWLLDEKRMG